MKAERSEDQITILLSPEEVTAVQEGRIVGDRFYTVILPDAKIEVLPLSAVEADGSKKYRFSDERLEKALTTPLKGKLFQNGDMQIFIPSVVLADIRVAGRIVSKGDIEDQMNGELINTWIPPKGLKIIFGGSLRAININYS